MYPYTSNKLRQSSQEQLSQPKEVSLVVLKMFFSLLSLLHTLSCARRSRLETRFDQDYIC